MRSPCCDKQDNNKGAWSMQEDQKLIDYIQKHGEGSWRLIPKTAGLLRCGKSCRLRWINYLRPDLKRGNFGEDEEDLIIKLHALLGNRWSLIAGRLPGRTDNEVKNYWNTYIRRKLIKMGIDPNNHRMNQLGSFRPHTTNTKETNSTTSEGNTAHLANTSTSNVDHVSDGISCLENEQLSGCRSLLPDLNLDVVDEEEIKTVKVVTTLMPSEVEFSPTPTLRLFS